ncbi:MAG TPA: ABC transporter permease [Gaiellaceae bacterium]|nr:ABC transporter permease [Gaiellaceae bacterium]
MTDRTPVGLDDPSPAPIEQPSGASAMFPAPVGLDELIAGEGIEVQARSQWTYARIRFVRHRLAMIGLFVLIVVFGAGALSSYVAPYGLQHIDITQSFAPPSWKHIFGTDQIGHDQFSMTLFGIRTSEEVGVLVAIISSIIGMVVGSIAGYYGGWVDNLLMRLTDLVLTLPLLAVLLTASALWGSGSQWRVTFIVALLIWTGGARIVRGIFLSLREKEYVEAAKAAGAGDMRIMFRHMLPNTMGPVIVNGTIAVAFAIILEAALSFLGFGIKAPTTSLGTLIVAGQNDPQKWWVTFFPGLVLLIIVLAINFIGDGLRDALDPTQRRVRA